MRPLEAFLGGVVLHLAIGAPLPFCRVARAVRPLCSFSRSVDLRWALGFAAQVALESAFLAASACDQQRHHQAEWRLLAVGYFTINVRRAFAFRCERKTLAVGC